VLLERVNALEGAESAVNRIISSLRKPIELDAERSVTVGASYGIAVYSGVEDTEELLRNADVAMYEAKQKNPGRWVVFEQGMETALKEKVSLESDLRRALERGQLLQCPHLELTGVHRAFGRREDAQHEFALVYQPIVSLATERIIAVEALARWEHPTRGPLSPELFIPMAERSEMIVALGRWVLREACRQASEWASLGHEISVSVNLSGKQLECEGIAQEVSAVLQETRLEPFRLTLEITESVIMRNAESTLARLNDLKMLGITLAIDDFGTGYSSLSYLQRFPVDTVKIDRVFIEGLRGGNDGIALVRTILALADMLGLRTVAEGVEDASQRALLRKLGCGAGQGYLFGKPLTTKEVTALFPAGKTAKRNANPREAVRCASGA
jgi:EAL domain-containing protein (putative c-di-GMP-specific phosphodiesterase class I)